MEFGRPTFAAWWNRIGEEYNVKANVSVAGDVYAKYGTRFGTQLVVIDKIDPDGKVPVSGNVETVQELIEKLDGVRNERPAASAMEQKSEGSAKGVRGDDPRADISGDGSAGMGDNERQGGKHDSGRGKHDAGISGRADGSKARDDSGSLFGDAMEEDPGSDPESVLGELLDLLHLTMTARVEGYPPVRRM